MAKKEIELTPENSIGGFLKGRIREAYFQKKLPQFLLEFQAQCSNLEEIEKLKLYLVDIQVGESNLIAEITKTLGEEAMGLVKEENAPLAKFLGEMSEEEKKQFIAWKDSCQNAINRILKIISSTRKDLKTKAQLKKDDWLDMALEIATLMKWVDEDRVYKDQMYRKILMTEKAKRGCSRLEAEEITKTTQEYRDYKFATLFKDNLTEFIMLAKKKGALDY